MGFEIVYSGSGTPHTIWAPIVDLDTIYVGQIVACQANEGIVPLGTATGANDTTGKNIPFGIVVGTNSYTPTYDSTQKTEKIVDVTPHDSVADYRLTGSRWAKGDRVAMAQIALIDPTTVIKGRIYNAAIGTATTVGTVTTGSATGVSCTVNALEVAGVANTSTLYFRSGANAGAYRITDDASTTAITWDKPTVNDVAVGDKLVRVNGLRLLGPSRAQFDAEALYVNSAAALTTDYYGIDVIDLNLAEAGNEYVVFRFNTDHFCGARA